ncbi:MAG: DUF4139 domain-containing protein [Planctomycetota bacterium]|nr:MAG: DUF4139 domain-containing protein [Planctomycetota bacterium]
MLATLREEQVVSAPAPREAGATPNDRHHPLLPFERTLMTPPPVALASEVREVTVYREGARVVRVAELEGDWPQAVRFEGLPLSLDDESVRVRVDAEGEAPRPADVRAEVGVPPASPAEAAPDPEALRAARRRAAELRRALARVDSELEHLRRVSLTLPAPRDGAVPAVAPSAAWRGALAWLAAAKKELLAERHELLAECRAGDEDVARLELRAAADRAQGDARAAQVSKRVVVRLRGPRGRGRGRLRLEYHVPGARWIPSYVVRVARDGRSARLALRAHVAQATGEAWQRVRLSLSTADLRRETALPELRSLRIGRRQPAPCRRAWRPPPEGSDDLFAGLDAAAQQSPGLRRLPPRADEELFDSGEDLSQLDEAYAPPPPDSVPLPEGDPFGGAPVRLASTAPTPSPSPEAVDAAAEKLFPAGGAPPPLRKRSGASPAAKSLSADAQACPPPSPPKAEAPAGVTPEASLLRYGDLLLRPWDDVPERRGRLEPAGWEERLGGLEAEAREAALRRLGEALDRAHRARSIDLPPGAVAVDDSSGGGAYRYDAEGPVDVPDDGTLHSVPLFARRASIALTLVVVPRESERAVRVARLENPLEIPLLAGPADVYLEDEFLVTARLRTVPAGGDLELGLGVEEALKVARKAFVREASRGLLGGGRDVVHEVRIEVASRLAVAAEVEVRERVPVPADEDESIEVVDERSDPTWEEFAQDEAVPLRGGRRWRFRLEPGAERELTFAYTLRLDAKDEVVGGNRREA